MTWLANVPQWGVIFLLLVRAVRIVHADLQDSRTLKKHGVLGIVLTEAAYVGLFAGFPLVGRLLDIPIAAPGPDCASPRGSYDHW